MMENTDFLFESTKSALNQQTLLLLVATLVVFGLLFWYNKKEVAYDFRNHKKLLMMLGAFVFLIALSSTFFSAWTAYKLQDITISNNQISTPYGQTKLDNIRRVYFQADIEKPRFSTRIATDTIHFLILEEYNRKTHALSEENYDIQKIYKTVEEMRK